jgi:copper transport protein
MTSRSWIGLASILVAVLAMAGSAQAHAEYVSSDPPANAILATSPTSVRIAFTEAVQSGSASVRITNASGARFDDGSASVTGDGRTVAVGLQAIGPGIYTVAWSVISAVDGHFSAGSFAFAVQNPDGTLPGPLPAGGPATVDAPVSPLEVVVRYLGFIGLALAFGASVLAAFVWIPAGRDPDVSEAPAYGLGIRVLLNLGRIGAFAYGSAFVGLILLADAAGNLLSVSAIVASSYLASVVARAGFGAALFVVLSLAFSRSRGPDSQGPSRLLLLAVVLALAAIVVGSLGTHAAASDFAAIGTAANAAHLVGVAFWVGGLASIAAVRSDLRSPDAVPLARFVLSGFSRLAGYAVALVLVGGAVLGVLLVRGLDDLMNTPYGRTVLVKIGLFVPLVVIGAWNRVGILPKIAEKEEAPRAARRIVRNVRVETGIGAATLAVAALLTVLTPAATYVAGPSVYTLAATVDGLRVDLEVVPVPTVPGVYTFSVYLWNATSGQAYEGGRNGTMTFTWLNGTIEQSANLTPVHGNHFTTTTPAMSQPGVWRIGVVLDRIETPDEVRATFHIVLTGGA